IDVTGCSEVLYRRSYLIDSPEGITSNLYRIQVRQDKNDRCNGYIWDARSNLGSHGLIPPAPDPNEPHWFLSRNHQLLVKRCGIAMDQVQAIKVNISNGSTHEKILLPSKVKRLGRYLIEPYMDLNGFGTPGTPSCQIVVTLVDIENSMS